MNTLIDRMPINDVAQVLETTPLNVLMHVKRGLLEGDEGADGWMISGASLIVFMARSDGKKINDRLQFGLQQGWWLR